MRRFGPSCGRFATRAPCSCGDRTFATDGKMMLAVRDGQQRSPCDDLFCRTLEEADRAVASGRPVKLPKLRKAVQSAIDAFQTKASDLSLRHSAELMPPGTDPRRWFQRQTEEKENLGSPALMIGYDKYQTRFLQNVLRCVGNSRARMAFVRREYGKPAFPRASVDMLALGDPDGSWTAAVMPLMPDQPHHAEAAPESLEGRRNR